jgi:hypothetical protein
LLCIVRHMSLRRFVSVSSVVVIATGAALAQPKKGDKAPAPAAPPAGSAAPTGSAAPAEGSAVQPIEDSPPADMEGRDENPDAPRGGEDKPQVVTAPTEPKTTGYPIELAQRPITLVANMAEVAIDPHIRVGAPVSGTTALRARYGITRQVQLGLTYVIGGLYGEPPGSDMDYKFHPGKAGGLDVTVLVTNWAAVRVGVPVYLDPFALSLAVGAPMKFHIGDKVAIGGLDDLLNITIKEFAPSFYQETLNAAAADRQMTGSAQSRGTLRLSAFGIYQHKPNLAIIGRAALEFDDFATNRGANGYGGATTSIHGGVSFSPKRFLDVGGTLGFDDLSQMPDSFTLSGFLAVRI